MSDPDLVNMPDWLLRNHQRIEQEETEIWERITSDPQFTRTRESLIEQGRYLADSIMPSPFTPDELAWEALRLRDVDVGVHHRWLRLLMTALALQEENAALRPRPQFGSGQGTVTLAEDFDAPLEEFKEYEG